MGVLIDPRVCKDNKRHAQCFIKRHAHHANPAIAKQMRNYFILEWLMGDLSNDEMIKTRSNHPPVHWRKAQYAYLVIEQLAKLNNYYALPQAPHARGGYLHPILGFPFELNLKFSQAQVDWLNANGWMVEAMDYSIA